MTCNAINHQESTRCAQRSGHDGEHEDEDGRTWPTKREREGHVPEPRDTSLDLACVKREDVGEDERWWVKPTPERVAAGHADCPMVMYAFHERDNAELVCSILNTSALADAMASLAKADEREAVPG